MLTSFIQTQATIPRTRFHLRPEMILCQIDYPLDWYQTEFIPYAEEYLALPDRKIETIVKWMRRYIDPALQTLGDQLLLLAHYYMGGEIVKLVETFGGQIGDSYQLALMAYDHPEKKIIVESAVHFMAESISILAHSDQHIYITNPKAGCTMEMIAKDYMVEPAISDLNERYGQENILPICYMNTSGRIKALAGAQNGAVCTSSNVKKIFQWAMAQHKKILFIPDKNMGENAAGWVGIPPEKIAYWPAGEAGTAFDLKTQSAHVLKQFDEAQLIIFSSLCSVHDYFRPEMIAYWQARGFSVVVHPECQKSVVDVADACGSTAFILDYVIEDQAHTKKYAIATENHMVDNVRQLCQEKNITVVNVGDAIIQGQPKMSCGCATMSRNDPPHLVATLDLLRQGKIPAYNEVQAGDIVNEITGTRTRLDPKGQQWIIENAKKALEKMIRITKS